MRTIILISILYFCYTDPVNAQCKPSITKVGGSFPKLKEGPICAGDLIFAEWFDNLNEGLWNHESQVDGCGNGEFEQYVNDRGISFVEDGKLTILPRVVGDVPLNNGYFNPVQSARMTTAGRFQFKYGKLETRAKLPAGDWLWPAIWMLPQNGEYGGWPRSGEIDIMESRGNKNMAIGGNVISTQLMFSTLHWGRSPGENMYQRTQWERRNGAGFDTDYHNYVVEWTPDYIAFSVDDQEMGRVVPPQGGFYELGGLSGDNPWAGGSKMAPFDKEFFLIINLAVGGTNGYFPDGVDNPGGKPWANWSPQAARDFWNGNWQWRPTWNEATEDRALKVDYIRIWAV